MFNKVKHLLRPTWHRARHEWYLARMARHVSWAAELRAVQREIAALDPHPDYRLKYRYHELFYWQNMPRWILEDTARHPIRRCLDIGCAFGTLLLLARRLANCEIYGIDVGHYISKALLAKHSLHYQICNIELDSCPWPGPFDIIFFTEVIEHLNFNCVPTLRKIRDLLADDGRLYLSTPDAASSWGKTTKYYRSYAELPQPATHSLGQTLIADCEHVWQFEADELQGCVAAAGLKILRCEYSCALHNSASRHFNLYIGKDSSS